MFTEALCYKQATLLGQARLYLSSRCFTDLQEHISNDVRAHLWRRLIYRDARCTALCFKMYLALTATCREHRAFLLESATREEQERVNRGQREFEADRRSNAEEERPRGFERRRLPVQHGERRCSRASIRFFNSFMIDFK